MSREVLDAIAEKIVPCAFSPDDLSICWHAGEPLTLPLDWYELACDRLQAAARDGQRLRYNVQTNGMLIDCRWIEFFRRRSFSVGISIDGPPEIHNANRVNRRGSGTFDQTLRGIDYMRRDGQPFDVIAVLTRASLRDPDAMFEFFAGLEPRTLGFNVDEIEGPHRASSLAGTDAEVALRRFLLRFFERHAKAGEPFALRPLVQLRNSFADGLIEPEHMTSASPTRTLDGIARPRRNRNDQIEPLSILTVAADGGLSTYSPELIGNPASEFSDFVFGNVREGGPSLLLANAHFQRLRRKVNAGRRRCARTCGYFDFCGGGAPGNKYFETGRFDIAETLYCRLSIQQMVEAALQHLEKHRPVPGGAP